MASSSSPAVMENDHPLILSPQFRDVLIKTINMLYPRDFVRLAATSKEMRDVCYQSPGVSVEFCLIIVVEETANGTQFKFLPRYAKLKRLSWSEMKELMDLPFYFDVSSVSYYNFRFPTNDVLVDATRFYLTKLGATKFNLLLMDSLVGNWDELVPLAKDYKVTLLGTNNSTINDRRLKEIMEMKLDRFFYQRSNVADEDIVACNIGGLDVKATFSKETAAEIIRRWLSKDLKIDEWSIGSSSLTQSDLSSLFRYYPTIYCDYYEGPLLDVRPLVVVKEDDGKDHFFLVREDNKVLNVFIWRHGVNLVTECNFSHRPDILEPLEYWDL